MKNSLFLRSIAAGIILCLAVQTAELASLGAAMNDLPHAPMLACPHAPSPFNEQALAPAAETAHSVITNSGVQAWKRITRIIRRKPQADRIEVDQHYLAKLFPWDDFLIYLVKDRLTASLSTCFDPTEQAHSTHEAFCLQVQRLIENVGMIQGKDAQAASSSQVRDEYLRLAGLLQSFIPQAEAILESWPSERAWCWDQADIDDVRHFVEGVLALTDTGHRPINVNDLLLHMENLVFSRYYEERSITACEWENRLSDNLPAVRMQSDALSHLLMSLLAPYLSAAVEANSKKLGQEFVTLNLRMSTGIEGENLVVRIENTGIPIEPSLTHISTVFPTHEIKGYIRMKMKALGWIKRRKFCPAAERAAMKLVRIISKALEKVYGNGSNHHPIDGKGYPLAVELARDLGGELTQLHERTDVRCSGFELRLPVTTEVSLPRAGPVADKDPFITDIIREIQMEPLARIGKGTCKIVFASENWVIKRHVDFRYVFSHRLAKHFSAFLRTVIRRPARPARLDFPHAIQRVRHQLKETLFCLLSGSIRSALLLLPTRYLENTVTYKECETLLRREQHGEDLARERLMGRDSQRALVPWKVTIPSSSIRLRRWFGLERTTADEVEQRVDKMFLQVLLAASSEEASKWFEKFIALQEEIWSRGAFVSDPTLPNIGVIGQDLYLIDNGNLIDDPQVIRQALSSDTPFNLERFRQKLLRRLPAHAELVEAFAARLTSMFSLENIRAHWPDPQDPRWGNGAEPLAVAGIDAGRPVSLKNPPDFDGLWWGPLAAFVIEASPAQLVEAIDQGWFSEKPIAHYFFIESIIVGLKRAVIQNNIKETARLTDLLFRKLVTTITAREETLRYVLSLIEKAREIAVDCVNSMRPGGWIFDPTGPEEMTEYLMRNCFNRIREEHAGGLINDRGTVSAPTDAELDAVVAQFKSWFDDFGIREFVYDILVGTDEEKSWSFFDEMAKPHKFRNESAVQSDSPLFAAGLRADQMEPPDERSVYTEDTFEDYVGVERLYGLIGTAGGAEFGADFLISKLRNPYRYAEYVRQAYQLQTDLASQPEALDKLNRQLSNLESLIKEGSKTISPWDSAHSQKSYDQQTAMYRRILTPETGELPVLLKQLSATLKTIDNPETQRLSTVLEQMEQEYLVDFPTDDPIFRSQPYRNDGYGIRSNGPRLDYSQQKFLGELEDTFAGLAGNSILAKLRLTNGFKSASFTNGEALLKISNAVNPVLKVEGKFHPVSLTIDDKFRVTVFSGLNTGGKTVAMKTASLITLMVQSGMPVPADAEIDEQMFSSFLRPAVSPWDIESGRNSQFSADLTASQKLDDGVRERSFVLIDDDLFGGSSEPAITASSFCATLEALKTKGAVCLAACHHLQALEVLREKITGIRFLRIKTTLGRDGEILSTREFEPGIAASSHGLQEASKRGWPGIGAAIKYFNLLADRLGQPRAREIEGKGPKAKPGKPRGFFYAKAEREFMEIENPYGSPSGSIQDESAKRFADHFISRHALPHPESIDGAPWRDAIQRFSTDQALLSNLDQALNSILQNDEKSDLENKLRPLETLAGFCQESGIPLLQEMARPIIHFHSADHAAAYPGVISRLQWHTLSNSLLNWDAWESGQDSEKTPQFVENIFALFALSEISHFAAENNEWPLPEQDDGRGNISIHEGWHSSLVDNPRKTPNTVEIKPGSETAGSLTIYTGFNTGGKSTLVKMIAQIVTLAKLGWPGPAASARVSEFSDIQVLSRVMSEGQHRKRGQGPARGSLEYLLHRSELAIQSATPRSLFILDEPFSGCTEPTVSASLTTALAEELTRRGATVILVTHMLDAVPLLLENVPNARCFHAETSEKDGQIEPLYKFTPGIAASSQGFEVAREMGWFGYDRALEYFRMLSKKQPGAGAPEPPRNSDGTFAAKPGGSPADVLRTVQENLGGSWVLPSRYHERFLPEVTRGTTYRDFRENFRRGYFERQRFPETHGEYAYRITDAGREAAAETGPARLTVDQTARMVRRHIAAIHELCGMIDLEELRQLRTNIKTTQALELYQTKLEELQQRHLPDFMKANQHLLDGVALIMQAGIPDQLPIVQMLMGDLAALASWAQDFFLLSGNRIGYKGLLNSCIPGKTLPHSAESTLATFRAEYAKYWWMTGEIPTRRSRFENSDEHERSEIAVRSIRHDHWNELSLYLKNLADAIAELPPKILYDYYRIIKDTATSQIENLISLIDGTIEGRRTSFSLIDAFRQASETIVLTPREEHLLAIDTAGLEGITVSGDYRKITETFRQLLLNTDRKMRNSKEALGKLMRITLTARKIPGATVIEYTDNAGGMSDSSLLKYSDPLTRERQNACLLNITGLPGGTGLGLAQVYHYVRMHDQGERHATIRIDNLMGADGNPTGFKATITLPDPKLSTDRPIKPAYSGRGARTAA